MSGGEKGGIGESRNGQTHTIFENYDYIYTTELELRDG